MSESKFYTKRMHEHCKAFFVENLKMLELEFSNSYSLQYPDLYKSTKHNHTTLFSFISESLNKSINSDYTVHRDNDLIDYRLKYLNSSKWADIVNQTKYLESPYVWYYFKPTCIPVKIRELVVDKFDLLEEFYIQSVKSHLKRFYIRGHVKEMWIYIDLLYKNGFNKYISQFNRFGAKSPEEIKSKLLNYTESGVYGLLKNASLCAPYTDDHGNTHEIQLLKYSFTNIPTNEPILFNSLVHDLNLSPTQYLINKGLLDVYLEEQNEPINLLRTRIGLPKIGEGWISETKLFYQLKDEFSNHVVLQHSKPKWLGRQHFDIYFPFLNIAIEYQGKQHFESVDYFGGNDAFKQNLLRDKRKKELAESNECELIYVEPGYNINEINSKIRSSKNFKKDILA